MCNSQADRGQKTHGMQKKGVQQIGQVEIHNAMVETNPWILASTANDMITFLKFYLHKVDERYTKVQEQVEMKGENK